MRRGNAEAEVAHDLSRFRPNPGRCRPAGITAAHRGKEQLGEQSRRSAGDRLPREERSRRAHRSFPGVAVRRITQREPEGCIRIGRGRHRWPCRVGRFVPWLCIVFAPSC